MAATRAAHKRGSDGLDTGETGKIARTDEHDAVAPKPTGRVLLNVGGTRYESAVDTLVNGGTGYFSRLFGPTGAAFGATDELFIDCDGALFAHVLHWMRRRTLPAAIYDHERLLMDVAGEADFFGLDCLQAACTQRAAEITAERQRRDEELRPKPRTARSFCCKVVKGSNAGIAPNGPGNSWWGETEGEMPQAQPGEVVYVHSAVLTGPFARLRRMAADADGEEDEYADTRCYMNSGTKEFGGDFQLQYAYVKDRGRIDEDSDAYDATTPVYVLAHRGLDDASVSDDNSVNDINFREVLDVVFDSKVTLTLTPTLTL